MISHTNSLIIHAIFNHSQMTAMNRGKSLFTSLFQLIDILNFLTNNGYLNVLQTLIKMKNKITGLTLKQEIEKEKDGNHDEEKYTEILEYL